MRLNPRTTDVTLASLPPGLQLAFGSETLPAPFTRTVLARSAISLNAPSPQGVLAWSSWSDGGAQPAHDHRARRRRVVTYTATFSAGPPQPAGPRPRPPVHLRRHRRARLRGRSRPGASTSPSGTKVPGGKLAGPLRVRGGKFGNALDFDGVNDWVTVKAPKLTAGR